MIIHDLLLFYGFHWGTVPAELSLLLNMWLQIGQSSCTLFALELFMLYLDRPIPICHQSPNRTLYNSRWRIIYEFPCRLYTPGAGLHALLNSTMTAVVPTPGVASAVVALAGCSNPNTDQRNQIRPRPKSLKYFRRCFLLFYGFHS